MKSDDARGHYALRLLLTMLSRGYGIGVSLRTALYRKELLPSKRLPCKVISVGNLTLGGTGKTPMTIKLAKLVQQLGYRVAVVSRGYQGTASQKGGIVSDGRSIFMGYDLSGDEPLMMALTLQSIPVAVGKNRFDIGMRVIEKFHPEVIILDDAFQHLKLRRDIDLLLLDYTRPFGNQRLFPRGVLREPVSQILRADALILTRSKTDADPPVFLRDELKMIKPVFRSFHNPYIHKIIGSGTSIDSEKTPLRDPKNFDMLKGQTVFVFSGIADNRGFRNGVESFGCRITGFMEFPDHHRYSEGDVRQVSHLATASGAKYLLTTEKDDIRMNGKFSFSLAYGVIGVEIVFGGEETAFRQFINDRLSH